MAHLIDHKKVLAEINRFYYNQTLSKNEAHTIQITFDGNEPFKLKYSKSDRNYLERIIQLNELFNCVNNSVPVELNSKWLNPFAFRINYRMWKSIYNTDFIDSYNQHIGASFVTSSIKRWLFRRGVNVPISRGSVNHFRDTWFGHPKNYVIRFEDFRIDEQIYQYLIIVLNVLK